LYCEASLAALHFVTPLPERTPCLQIGYAVMFLQKLSGNPVPKPLPRSSAAFKAWFSPALEKIFGTATAASALGSLLLPGVRAIEQTFFFTSTFFSFIFASRLPERLPRSFAEYWHPLLTTFLSVPPPPCGSWPCLSKHDQELTFLSCSRLPC
jgi:hypothetical protein